MLFALIKTSENADGGADIIRSRFPGMYEVEIKNSYSSSTFTTNFFSLKCMSEWKTHRHPAECYWVKGESNIEKVEPQLQFTSEVVSFELC